MNNKKKELIKEESFELLRHIEKKPKANQRELAQDLGLSLGKLNYLLIALKDKGLVKLKNFSGNPKKIQYLYSLTPKGLAQKTHLTIDFMKRKMKEYDQLKKELEK
jgi:EPS-associated MarR family transcriptional regulator